MMARRWFCRVCVLVVLLAFNLFLLCTVLLDDHATRRYYTEQQNRSTPRWNDIQWCQPLRFRDIPGPTVALASFPGSGNTWVRYLLQQATGLRTGSVYRDLHLLKNGFPGEGVYNGSVSVVKTHEWGATGRQPFSKAVLVVRSARDAIHSEFNRQSRGHFGHASLDKYINNKGRYWQEFVSDKLFAWRRINLDWIHNFTGPLHVVFYDQLVDDVEPELRRLLDFLHMRVERFHLACAVDRKEGIYKRRRPTVSFDPFTQQMKEMVKKEQDLVYDAIYKRIS